MFLFCLFALGSFTGGDKDFKLHAGKSEYPFSVQIPMGAPSSYEAQIGKVR